VAQALQQRSGPLFLQSRTALAGLGKRPAERPKGSPQAEKPVANVNQARETRPS
jgi:hypothetical protein